MTNTLTAMEFFSAKLAYEMAPEDLDLMQAEGTGPLVVDTRSAAAWSHARIPGATYIPSREIAVRAAHDLPDEDADIVIYSWGLGSVDASRAALALLTLGYSHIRELSGGFEAWEAQGFALESDEDDRDALAG